MVFLFASSATAANTVVVIPLNSSKKLKNVITVSAQGGDFINPVSAVKSITGATAENPYLVAIGPGIYTLTETLIMKPYVSIVGAGEHATTLTGAVNGASEKESAMIRGANDAFLGYLTVEHTGGGDQAVAIYNEETAPDIRNVVATASAGTNSNYGVFNRSSSPSMRDMVVTVSGGTYNYAVSNLRDDVANPKSSPLMKEIRVSAIGGTYSMGIRNSLGADPLMIEVVARATGGVTNYAIWNESSCSPKMTSITAEASGGAVNQGIRNTGSSSPTMEYINITASGGGAISYGIYNENSNVTIRKSTISGTTAGVFTEAPGGSAEYIISHSIVTNGITGPGAHLCIFTGDEQGVVYTSACSVPTSP